MSARVLAFTKMSGAGNDFVMVDNRDGTRSLGEREIEWLCDRRRGIGADGLILLEPGPADGSAGFRMRYYNRDGCEAEMCGNGARCFARFAEREAGARDSVSFVTPAGVIRAELLGERVRLRMSDPRDWRMGLRLEAGGEGFEVCHVNTGVPHAVTFVRGLEGVDVERSGAALRYHPAFAPAGANANFVERAGDRALSIRTYERGVEGETLACGTGVVASALVFAELEGIGGPISVRVRGGDVMEVGFERGGRGIEAVTLLGPADFVFDGTIPLAGGGMLGTGLAR